MGFTVHIPSTFTQAMMNMEGEKHIHVQARLLRYSESMQDSWLTYLAILLCIGSCEQRMKNYDCFIQIPNKYTLKKEVGTVLLNKQHQSPTPIPPRGLKVKSVLKFN